MSDSKPFIPPVSFEYGSITIRAYKPGDGAALQASAVESYEHLKPWMPWADPNLTVEQAEATVRRLCGGFHCGTDYTMGIWEGDALLGGTGFHPRHGPIEWKCAEIGMWIRSSRAGQGMGVKSLQAMLAWGFTEWGWERLLWKCDTRNIASARVAEKNGLIREATLLSDALDVDGNRRDTYMYRILKSDWVP